ncbi:MAG: lipopolysaccharide transport system ATP-binding protein [Desulforhopalus sp.]|jgi:lipopolysaccharide transport system ATP-binding protein
MSAIIKVENLSKKYIIGHQKQERYTALRDVIAHKFKRLGKRICHPLSHSSEEGTQEEFWALKDINFEIKQGDRVGIIGGNGAGKSTLLKILSRITEPTTGRLTIRGRVASLLEVGTGFHPELTGRENIFLNGAILGMGKAEIKRKFDEIVNFAEVEKFLDTPVKRYSSGMYVRLAFAVAAHLEPEILLVDEVLAVGDAAFQEKCLGKMENISKEGRTLLFVSHNLAFIRALCTKSILLEKSILRLNSSTENVIKSYLSTHIQKESSIQWSDDITVRSEYVLFHKAYLMDASQTHISGIDCNGDFYIAIEYEVLKSVKSLRIGFILQNSEGVLICGSNDLAEWPEVYREIGFYKSYCKFPGNILAQGVHSLCFGASKFPYEKPLIRTDFCLTFTVNDTDREGMTKEKLPGVIKPNISWQVDFIRN